MQVVRIKSSFFDAGQEVWAGGKCYPVTDASMRQVELGNAEVVDAEATPAEAEQAAADANEAPAGKQAGKRRNQG